MILIPEICIASGAVGISGVGVESFRLPVPLIVEKRLICDPPLDAIDGYKIMCDGVLIATVATNAALDHKVTNLDCIYTVATYRDLQTSEYVMAMDFDQDGDLDGVDLAEAIRQGADIEYFSKHFGGIHEENN